jgi:hypothetical protein
MFRPPMTWILSLFFLGLQAAPLPALERPGPLSLLSSPEQRATRLVELGYLVVSLYLALGLFVGVGLCIYWALARRDRRWFEMPGELEAPEEAQAPPQPTESEAILRAMEGPDPLHPMPLPHDDPGQGEHRSAA